MWWRMLHQGEAPRTNVHCAMEKLKAVWYYFVPAGMSLPNLQVTPRLLVELHVVHPHSTGDRLFERVSHLQPGPPTA
eukprot:3131434-Rhodomonas_salina.2